MPLRPGNLPLGGRGGAGGGGGGAASEAAAEAAAAAAAAAAAKAAAEAAVAAVAAVAVAEVPSLSGELFFGGFGGELPDVDCPCSEFDPFLRGLPGLPSCVPGREPDEFESFEDAEDCKMFS